MFDRVLQNEQRVGELKSIQIPRGVRARVYNDADITLTTAILTTLTFNQERYDTDTIHSTSSNTSRLTIPFAGYYTVTANIRFASNAVGTRRAQLVVNGVTTIGVTTVHAALAGVVEIQVVSTYLFAAGDYIECVAQQTSGGNLAVVSQGNFSPEFWIEKEIN